MSYVHFPLGTSRAIPALVPVTAHPLIRHHELHLHSDVLTFCFSLSMYSGVTHGVLAYLLDQRGEANGDGLAQNYVDTWWPSAHTR